MHVINAMTSLNILLSRPLIHKNKIASSSYYQWLKYLEDGVEIKIVVADKSFAEFESHDANANST